MVVMIPGGVNLHVHLRNARSTLFNWAVPLMDWYDTIGIQPNTTPPIRVAGDVVSYRQEVVARTHRKVVPLMTLMLTPDITSDDVRRAYDIGIFAIKGYPKGATTNSDHGIEDFFAPNLMEVYQTMTEFGLPLLLHCAEGGAPFLEEERRFHPTLIKLMDETGLTSSHEHVTTSDGLDIVRAYYPRMFGTLTLHHGWLNWEQVLGPDGKTVIAPEKWCKTVANTVPNMLKVQAAILSGEECFGLGDDLAPHLWVNKQKIPPVAGVCLAPQDLYAMMASKFQQSSSDPQWAQGWIERMVAYSSGNGRKFHRLSPSSSWIYLVDKDEPEFKGDWKVQDSYAIFGTDDSVVPWTAGESYPWVAFQCINENWGSRQVETAEGTIQLKDRRR